MQCVVALQPQILALIEYVANEFLEHILERHDTLDVSVFVNDDCHVTSGLLKRSQQRIKGCCFRHNDQLVDQA